MPNQNQEILFYLPITKQWLEEYALVHFQQGTSYRGILYSFETLFDLKRSIGWCHNVIHNASDTAKLLQNTEYLSNINISANDELFDGSKPILTSVCTNSLYCPLLKKSDDRKAKTWEEVLKELIENTVITIMNEIEKASSVVENLNGRIRVHVSQDVLDLLRLIINHRKFERSRCEHRQGKSPAQVLHEQNHHHWLDIVMGHKMWVFRFYIDADHKKQSVLNQRFAA